MLFIRHRLLSETLHGLDYIISHNINGRLSDLLNILLIAIADHGLRRVPCDLLRLQLLVLKLLRSRNENRIIIQLRNTARLLNTQLAIFIVSEHREELHRGVVVLLDLLQVMDEVLAYVFFWDLILLLLFSFAEAAAWAVEFVRHLLCAGVIAVYVFDRWSYFPSFVFLLFLLFHFVVQLTF
jgi:hypothetical protein